jgi:hypothetical protein
LAEAGRNYWALCACAMPILGFGLGGLPGLRIWEKPREKLSAAADRASLAVQAISLRVGVLHGKLIRDCAKAGLRGDGRRLAGESSIRGWRRREESAGRAWSTEDSRACLQVEHVGGHDQTAGPL